MVIENESRLTAVREGRVLDGKIQIEGSSETFTLVLSNKEVVVPEIMGPDAYGEIDPIHVSDREYGKVQFYNDTEECLYKGDRGNILYFSARSTSCNTPCGDMNELIHFVLYGSLSEELKDASHRVVWVSDVANCTRDYVMIQDEAFYSKVKSLYAPEVCWYIHNYVKDAYGDFPIGFGAGIIRDGVFESLC
ncbi:MAG: hypothetical protein IJB20_10765 [Clostridia bacterium]|nr:hypothetical protein [Clostridia bacterium]